MLTRFSVDVLRVLLVLALLATLALQVLVLPWLSGAMAEHLPDEAFMRWPLLTLSLTGLACVEVGVLCTIRLLGLTRRDEVFARRSLRWVDGIIVALLAGSAVCLATLLYQSATVGGPPAFSLLLIGGITGGIGTALLMAVMRSLLVRATELRLEMEAVI